MSHEFGIRVLKTAKEANEIVRKSRTYFWTKAIVKKMANIRI